MDIHIRKARPSEATRLQQLAYRSKSHWDYSEDYLKKCFDALEVKEESIYDGMTFIAEWDDKILGFFAFLKEESEIILDHMWLEPQYIGKGLGRLLFKEAVGIAKAFQWKTFTWAADPPAEGFYLKMGAQKVGVTRSMVEPNMFLPQMEFRV